MTANINPETGIPYGVVNGHTVPYLLDDITTSGDDLTYAAFKSELRDKVAAALAGCLSDNVSDESAAEIVKRGVDCDEIVESLLDAGLNDRLEFDESDYSYESDGTRYRLGWLGGAPLIWILESRYVTYAPACSPCVPNAGDLDNLSTDGETGGILCYCCPPDDFKSDDESADEFVITGETEINGKTYEIVARKTSDNWYVDDRGFMRPKTAAGSPGRGLPRRGETRHYETRRRKTVCSIRGR